MATSKIKGTATYEELHAYAIEAFTCDPENTGLGAAQAWDFVAKHGLSIMAANQVIPRARTHVYGEDEGVRIVLVDTETGEARVA